MMNEKVFVVYGRNEEHRKAIFTLLRAAGLMPMEWEQIVALTGKASPYVGDVIKKGFEECQAIVVLFSDDDIAKLRPDLCQDAHDGNEEYQPRANVILEAGMAIGMKDDKTIIVELGKTRNISDLAGRHVIRMNNSIERRKTLLARLENAGCKVHFAGNDWMTAGDFR